MLRRTFTFSIIPYILIRNQLKFRFLIENAPRTSSANVAGSCTIAVKSLKSRTAAPARVKRTTKTTISILLLPPMLPAAMSNPKYDFLYFFIYSPGCSSLFPIPPSPPPNPEKTKKFCNEYHLLKLVTAAFLGLPRSSTSQNTLDSVLSGEMGRKKSAPPGNCQQMTCFLGGNLLRYMRY